MKHLFLSNTCVVALCISIVACSACDVRGTGSQPRAFRGPHAESNPNAPKAVTQLGLIKCTTIQPIREQSSFSEMLAGLRFSIQKEKNIEATFSSNAEATSAAQRWIEDHFGPLPPNTTLDTIEVLQSSSARAKPINSSDRGYTISFSQTYKGIRTDLISTVYFAGTQCYLANVNIATIVEINRTQKDIIPETAARDVFSDYFRSKRVPEDDIKSLAGISLNLMYIWDAKQNNESNGKITVLAPVWTFPDSRRIVASAFNGKVWIND